MLGPFVIECLEKKSSVDLLASGSFHIFCNTQPVWVFACQSHGHNKLEETSRAMKNNICSHLIAYWGLSGLAVSIIHTSG